MKCEVVEGLMFYLLVIILIYGDIRRVNIDTCLHISNTPGGWTHVITTKISDKFANIFYSFEIF